ncbi:uncharacterized protein K02A2.6-like [Spodoptera frugiperda]|uniref:RNA-directed DNA polymerase n=1 Tax=Spodoptera frugiperda TaxID=7108 RepID=A0A9R0EC81_SPOFR|nr:uncharacterized protein K02A2.6-like [Spodoptera frugiperda]
MVASRMQRWAIILSAYSFNIEYVRTDQNGADGFSRLPLALKSQITSLAQPVQTHLHFVQQSLLLDYNEIKHKTLRDAELSKILSYVRDGWPDECDLRNLKPYFNRRNELYEELGCIMWGHRLVVPEACRNKVILMLHEPHMGIVKSKALARSYVWWPGVDEAVEHMCRACEVCATQADAPSRQTPRMWPWPNRPWSRIHIDYMGPIGGRTYLVVVDATSKWLEVFNVSSTTAVNLIDRLSELFSRWGLPRQIVSDNGTQFASKEFQEFTQFNGIEHVFTAPYHPASNGLAENAVRLLKRVIKKAIFEKQNIDKAVWTFLMHYRNVEHSTTGESPAMILLGRRIRTRLDIIKPDRENKVHRAQKRQAESVRGASRCIGGEGDEVWYRQYLKGEKWVPGRLVESLGPSNYRVQGQSGEIVHKHIDQLRRRTGNRLSVAASGPSITERSDTDSQTISREDGKEIGERVQSERSPERVVTSRDVASPARLSRDTPVDVQPSAESQVALPQVSQPPQRAGGV